MGQIIGIGGPSCAGKTTLARALERKLGDAVTISMDMYYHDLSHLPLCDREKVNFDHPDAFDVGELCKNLRAVSQGRPVSIPDYDFAEHARRPRMHTVEPAAYVICEGILALHFDELRALMDLTVYVEIATETALTRRIARDGIDRGRPRHSIMRQFESTVVPMIEAYVAPTRDRAHVIVEGSRNVDTMAMVVMGMLNAAPD